MCRMQLLSNDNSSSCEQRSKPCQQQPGIRIGQTERYPFNGLFSRTTWVSRHQKGYTSLEFNEARHNGVAVASVASYVNYLHLTHDSTSSLIFTGRMLFLTFNQQYQSTENKLEPAVDRVQALADISRSMLCCHSNETRRHSLSFPLVTSGSVQ